MTKVLIVEDEQPAARQLIRLLQQIRPDAQIVGVMESVQSAVQYLQEHAAPDLMFFDIQIADGISFDIFKQVKITAPVIFTTAYDEYAVQAFRVNAIDYLLKPIDPADLEQACQKALNRPVPELQAVLTQWMQHLEVPRYKERFLVKSGQHQIVLPLSEIAYFRSDDGLTQAYTLTGKRYFVESTIEELEQQVAPSHFFRVSRKYLMRIQAIQAIHPHLNGRLKITAAPPPPDDVMVSRERAGAFKEWVAGG